MNKFSITFYLHLVAIFTYCDIKKWETGGCYRGMQSTVIFFIYYYFLNPIRRASASHFGFGVREHLLRSL